MAAATPMWSLVSIDRHTFLLAQRGRLAFGACNHRHVTLDKLVRRAIIIPTAYRLPHRGMCVDQGFGVSVDDLISPWPNQRWQILRVVAQLYLQFLDCVSQTLDSILGLRLEQPEFCCQLGDDGAFVFVAFVDVNSWCHRLAVVDGGDFLLHCRGVLQVVAVPEGYTHIHRHRFQGLLGIFQYDVAFPPPKVSNLADRPALTDVL